MDEGDSAHVAFGEGDAKDTQLEDDDPESNEEPAAEMDEPDLPKREPSYVKANALRFFEVCRRLEKLWQLRVTRPKKPPSMESKLQALLPPQLLSYFDGHDPPESVFPLFRLLMPELDGSRRLFMKERTIATAYAGAFSLSAGQADYEKLFHPTDPNIAGKDAGDFSLVLMNVVKNRIPYDRTLRTGSDYTLGEINSLLDDLADIKRKAFASTSNHDWKASPKKKSRPTTIKDLRSEWVRRLMPAMNGRKGLSPLEHKWLVRIMQEQLQFGIGWKRILEWYNPYGPILWSAHNSLKGVCNALCDPALSTMRKLPKQDNSKDVERKGLSSYMPQSMAPIKFGIPFHPMLSERTGFQRILDDISRRHRDYISDDDHAELEDCLAFRHPVFSVETKLDGERLIVHYSFQDGVVKLHTRRGNWYSELYSPVLGPSIRRALCNYQVNAILDGEVLAWDDGRKETVPFGNNRTIAILRTKWMRQNGLLDERDRGMHVDEKEFKSMNSSNTWSNKGESVSESLLAGEECWLQFVIFDVVFVDGPDAIKLLEESVAPQYAPFPMPGPLLSLDGIERKKILHRLVETQDREVEIVSTWIVRPNGITANGEEYFSPQDPIIECGYPAYMIDSLSLLNLGSIPRRAEIDMERRFGMSDEQISQARANSVDAIYQLTVEGRRMEGLIFKDLSAPYYVGDESRSLRYWHKFKPDYFNGSVASDLDLLIIGAYFATGLRYAGKPSSFLVACVDSDDRELFMPFCKVNGGSMERDSFLRLLNQTGFVKPDEEESDSRNFWFRDADHGKSLPDFISMRSFQCGQEGKGWKFTKPDYPDLWIHPNDSVVITVNAGEVVVSDIFSVGLTLRFPRITRIREGNDGKRPSDVENDVSLWRIYQDVAESRTNDEGNRADSLVLGSPSKDLSGRACRFLTEQQYHATRKSKTSTKTREKPAIIMHHHKVLRETRLLEGMSISALDGNYNISEESAEAMEAAEQGWYEEALSVKDQNDVKAFVKRHGGRVIISPDDETLVVGGQRTDARVISFIRAIENAHAAVESVPTKTSTQKAMRNQAIALNAGVVRWTYLYSRVYIWLSRGGVDKNEPIGRVAPEWFQPSWLDFLARPKHGTKNVREIQSVEITSASLMQRAINQIAQEDPSDDGSSAEYTLWQDLARARLEKDERWIMSCGNQCFWPYSAEAPCEQGSAVVMYSDLGESGEGDSESLCSTQAALLMARIMGANVSRTLDDSVTHILCHLKEGFTFVQFHDDLESSTFASKTGGSRLLMKVKSLQNSRAVVFVSPSWIPDKWQSSILTCD